MAALQNQKSRESLRLQALSKLSQIRDRECQEIPIEIGRRAKANLWGQLPVEAMVKLRSLPDKTVRVFAALVSLLQGSKRQVQVAEVAFLSALKDRQTREHLKKLDQAGLIGCRRSLRGPNWYWQVTDCAGQQYSHTGNARLPKQSGSLALPTKDYINQKRSLTPPAPPNITASQPTKTNQGRGGNFSKSKTPPRQKESFQKPLSKSLTQDYFEQRKAHQEAQNTFESTCRQVSEQLATNLTSAAQKQSIEQAITREKIPQWWVEMLDQVPLSGRSQKILAEAAPRDRSENTIAIGLDRFLAARAKMRQADLDAAFSLLTGSSYQLAIYGDKQPNEVSVADIHRTVEHQTPNPDKVQQMALKLLGWQTKPKFKTLESIERYGKDASSVIDLAKKSGQGRELEILEKWAQYPVEAVVRMVEFEKEKAETGQPVRSYKHWWKKTLGGIVEKLEH